MRIVILQPSYLPWLGAFDQLRRADLFVLYDDVQYDKNGWRNRNRIKTAAGPNWLTVPVLTSGKSGQTIRDTRIDPHHKWAEKHQQALRTHYARAPHFESVFALLEPMLSPAWRWLGELDEALFRLLAGAMRIDRRVVRSGDLRIGGGQSERLVNICRRFGATDYLSGAAARDYLDVAQFEAAGIRVEFQAYAHPIYPQLHGAFLPYLSIVDLMMNVGPIAAAEWLTRGVEVQA